MFTDRALIDQSTALHYTVRGMIQFVALPAHPVERERSESEIQVLQEDLFSISSCLVFRKEDNPNLPCSWEFGIDLEERQAREFTRHGVSGRRIVPHPVNPPRFFDSVLQEHSNLLIVLKPDEDLVHHFRIGCDPADIIQIVLGQVHENLVFSLREERHGIFLKICPLHYNFRDNCGNLFCAF